MKTRILMLIVGLLSLVSTAQAASVPISESFINNGTYISLSNNYTLLYGSTTNIRFVSFEISTNIIGGASNTISPGGLSFPQILRDVTVRPDGLSEVNDSCSISVTIGVATNFFSQRGHGGLPFPNAGQNFWNIPNGMTNGVGGPYVPVSLFPQGALGSSNVLTFVFQKSVDGMTYGTTAQDKFQFVVAQTAAILATDAGKPHTINTNLPSSFMQGAKKLRCLSVASDNSAGAIGVTINTISFNQFAP